MLNQIIPKDTENSERLAVLLSQLSIVQIRFCVARLETKTDKQAAADIGITDGVVKNWNDDGKKAIVDETVRLMAYDGVATARELRRRNLAKAMAVKIAALESDNEKIKQDAATEIIEWEMGKALQKVAPTTPDGVNPYLSASVEDLIELASQIVNSKK